MKRILTSTEMALVLEHFSSKESVVVADQGIISAKDYDHSFGCPYLEVSPIKFDNFDHFYEAVISAQNTIDDQIADAIYNAANDYTDEDKYDYEEN